MPPVPIDLDDDQIEAWRRGRRAAVAAMTEGRRGMQDAIDNADNWHTKAVLQGLVDHVDRHHHEEDEDAALQELLGLDLLGHDSGEQAVAVERQPGRRGNVGVGRRKASTTTDRRRTGGSRRAPKPPLSAPLDGLS